MKLPLITIKGTLCRSTISTDKKQFNLYGYFSPNPINFYFTLQQIGDSYICVRRFNPWN